MRRSAVSVVCGIAVAFVIVFVVDMIVHFMYGPKELPTDPAALKEMIANMPVNAYLLLLMGWTLAAFVGSFTASRIAVWGRFYHGLLVGDVILIATAINLFMTPHPILFSIISLVAVIAARLAGAQMAPGKGRLK